MLVQSANRTAALSTLVDLGPNAGKRFMRLSRDFVGFVDLYKIEGMLVALQLG